MTNEKETTLEEDIRAAMEPKDETTTQETATAEPATKEETTERQRDESGRFQKREEHTTSSEVQAAAKLQPDTTKTESQSTAVAGSESILTQDKAPQGWTPAIREKWGAIPEDVRSEILRREEDSVRGVRQLQERYAPLENFAKGMEPVFREAQAAGAAPDQYIYSLANTERLLRTADLPTKFQEILRLSDLYGIPLRDVINKSVGEEVIKPATQQQGYLPPEVQRELEEMRQWRSEFENNSVEREISAFAEGKEFFKDVHLQMAALFEGGVAKDLQDAYDTACWANPQVREVLLARQKGGEKQEELKQKQQAAAGASIKPNGAIEAEAFADDDDLAATVRKSFAAAATGRV